jgi:hypothetical protein
MWFCIGGNLGDMAMGGDDLCRSIGNPWFIFPSAPIAVIRAQTPPRADLDFIRGIHPCGGRD